MKKIIVLGLLALLLLIDVAQAQTTTPAQTVKVEYADQEPMDSDLDGLTDQAEVQIYKTDVKNQDTDGDAYYDGAEVIAGSNPLDVNSTPISVSSLKSSDSSTTSQDETPWAWYISRASGLVAFLLLYLSIFLALTIRLPFLRTIFAPVYALNAHGWIALQATIFALTHGLVLTLDKFLEFSFVSVLVPFASDYEKNFVALGTIGFYLMVLLVVTSYARKYIPFRIWRMIHFFNIGLYFIVIAHALYLGTDLRNDYARNIFIVANIFLILCMLANMFFRIKANIARKNGIIIE